MLDKTHAVVITKQVLVCSELARVKSLRKPGFARAYGLMRALYLTLSEKLDNPASSIGTIVPPTVNPNKICPEDYYFDDEGEDNAPGEMGWDMQDVMMDPRFKWDSFLLDMVLDTDLAPV